MAILRIRRIDVIAVTHIFSSGDCCTCFFCCFYVLLLFELHMLVWFSLWGLSPCQLQRGVCRLNCLDSLDRTNEVQLHMHRAFALRFLRSLPAAVTIDSALDEQAGLAIIADCKRAQLHFPLVTKAYSWALAQNRVALKTQLW